MSEGLEALTKLVRVVMSYRPDKARPDQRRDKGGSSQRPPPKPGPGQ